MNKTIHILLATTVLSGMALSSNIVSADTEVIDTVELTVPVACTMSGTGITHTATLNPGTYSGASGSEYENGIGKTTLTAICNDDNGFSIYAIGYTGNQYEGENHTKLVGTNTNGTIATKAYVSGDTSSNWSMKLTKITNPCSGDPITYNPENLTITTNYDNWIAVPATYTKVAQYKANTGSSATDTTLGVKLETTYAAYIASNQAADIYVGQVKYTMVHPYNDVPAQPQTSASGKICYYANASNAEGTMGCQDVASTVTLLASNFSRTGYGFAGWSDKFDYATNNEAHFYGPQEDLSIPDTSIYTGEGKGLSLYAVWVKSQGNLQDTSKVASVCSNLTTAPTDGTANLASVSALTDQRDNETYAIAKLADGKCWMIENLRLESTNSDNSTGALAQGYGTSATYGNFSGLADAETANKFNSTYSANTLYSNDGSNDTINIGTSNAAYRMPRYNNVNTPTTESDRPQNPTANSSTNSTSNAGMYSYGNYYTWHAAIADTTAYSSGDHNTTSICPTGWQIPLGNTSTGDIGQSEADAANRVGGFSYLDRKMGGTGQDQSTTADSLRWRKYPVNFVYSGYVYSGSVNPRGSYVYYWSSTAYSSYYAYNLYLGPSYVYPGTLDGNKYYGRAIRCVAPGA